MSDIKAGTKTYDVAVLGCGLMGAALARNFAKQGLKTAAWNRTPAKAEALSGDGVTAVHDVDELVRSSKLVVACTSTYETTRKALEGATDWTGTALVNVGTGTPTDAEELGAWASERDVPYLDGAIICYPQQIGTEEGLVLYSGAPEVWAEHEKTLRTPGAPSTLVSDNVKAASVLDAAVVGGFYSASLSAYVEAATYALDQGVDPEVLAGISDLAFQTIAASAREAITAIVTDEHETETAYLGVYAEGCRATFSAMRDAGFKARLLGATVENLNDGEKAGLGEQGFFALTKVARTDV